MQKSNSILAKALNEADTIKAGALRNANELLIEMFQPKFKQYLNSAINEQTMNTQEATPSMFDADAGEDGVENPEDTINVGGEGAPLLEQEDDFEDPDEIVEIDEEDDEDLMDEQMNPEFDDDEMLGEYDDEIDNLDEQDDIDLEIDEQDEFDDEELMDEQDEFDSLDDDDIVEIDDELLDEADTDDDDDDDDDLNEDWNDVNTSQDEEIPMAANESLIRRNRKLRKENAILRKQSRINTFGIKKLKSKLSEVNLFNQKLAYSMKAINRNGGLTVNEKKNIISQFDNCKSLREVKITYNAISRFSNKNARGKRISESTRRMFSKINENKKNSGKNNGSFDSRTMRMAGLE